jgi:hypothetical protein
LTVGYLTVGYLTVGYLTVGYLTVGYLAIRTRSPKVVALGCRRLGKGLH